MDELPEIAAPFLLNPALLKTQDGDYEEDDFATKCAWGAHAFDTGMTPFYSAQQLRAAMEAAHKLATDAAQERSRLMFDALDKARAFVNRMESGEAPTAMLDALRVSLAAVETKP